jgi:peptide/nickel transport system substrate-binding protein
MNTQRFPTSITDFRLALAYSVNYSALDQSYYYGNDYLANNYLGPVSPNFQSYYNPGDLSCITYNLQLAEHYINLAGIEGHFFVTLKNGTKLGDTSLSSPVTVYIELTVHDLTRNMLMVSKNL